MSENEVAAPRRAKSSGKKKRKTSRPANVEIPRSKPSAPNGDGVSPLSDSEENRAAMAALEHHRRHPELSPPFTPPSLLRTRTKQPPPSRQANIAEPVIGCWLTLKRWRVWQYLFKALPYLIAAAQVILMICVGMSGSDAVPAEWRWYFCKVGQYRLGAMGYCDDSTGLCTSSFFYNIIYPSHSTWTSTVVLCSLLVPIAIGGMMASLSYLLLLCRVLADSPWSGQDCFTCCALSCSRCYPKDALEERGTLAGWWFERTMFFVLLWSLAIGGLTMVWVSSADAEGLQGDSMLTAVMIMSGAWLPLYWVYNSSWSGVQTDPRVRKKRQLIRGENSV